MQFLNVFRIDPRNCGDLASTPCNYFDLGEVERIDILNLPEQIPQRPTIIGGGGVAVFDAILPKLVAQCSRPLIGWGIGANEPVKEIRWPKCFDAFDLLGCRDWNSPYRYVPCASCMSPLFDRHYVVRHEVGVYRHKDYRCGLEHSGLPMIKNKVPMDRAIEFIGSCETILTNSYHGALWGTWLGRKVVIVGGNNTNKFQGLRYEGTLEESRRLNMEFYREVIELLSVEQTPLALAKGERG